MTLNGRSLGGKTFKDITGNPSEDKDGLQRSFVLNQRPERSTIRPFSTTTITDSTTSSVTDDKEKEGSRSRNARHVQKRSPKRQQKSAKSVMPRQKREASKTKLAPLPVPQHTIGAGNELGLSVMVDNQIEKYFLTSGSFVGSKVLVHHPEDFPLVRDRGFVIGPGQEVFVGVDGADVYSTLDAKTVDAIKRKCYFRDERTLDYYTNYTRSNCLLECSFKFIKSVCGCVPYYFPNNGLSSICGLKDLACLKNASSTLKSLYYASLADVEVMQLLQKKGIDCNCPAACAETSYKIEVSSAPFPSEPAFWKMKNKRTKMGMDYFRDEVSLLHVFFKSEFIVQYKRDQLYGIEDLVSNIGGLMGLCLGFSLLSVVELIYFFTLRWCVLCCRRKGGGGGGIQNMKHENSYDDESLPRPNTTSILINGRVLPTSSEVFDHIFKQQ